MKLYLSGPMTGLPDYNKPSFYRAAAELRVAGHEVVNPAEHDQLPAGAQWADYIRKDLVLLAYCDGIAVLPGWTHSRGARLEVYIATQLGLPVLDAHTQAPVRLLMDEVKPFVLPTNLPINPEPAS